MNVYIPIVMMFISLILIGISLFLVYYYKTIYGLVIFIFGILLGIIACILFIYFRTPSVVNEENKVIKNNITYVDYTDEFYKPAMNELHEI
jgi:tellurite resistance protein TehA-like permease